MQALCETVLWPEMPVSYFLAISERENKYEQYNLKAKTTREYKQRRWDRDFTFCKFKFLICNHDYVPLYSVKQWENREELCVRVCIKLRVNLFVRCKWMEQKKHFQFSHKLFYQ